MANERNMPEKVYVHSHHVQIALQSFINRHRNSLQKLMDQNQKLAQNNSMLNAHVSNHEGTIMALNEKIAANAKEIAKYKEEQTRLMDNKKLLRSELMTYKKRCGELMICSEKEKVELQQKIGELQNELKERDVKEAELENKLDVIRKELQTKIDECNKSNEKLFLVETEMNASKQQIEEIEKSLINLKDELKEKDETIIKLRKEHEEYKIETEKNISKMQEVQRIFYPNASNPLPRPHQTTEMRSTLPTSITVQPRPQSRSILKRSSATSSSESESENEHEALARGWAPPRTFDDLRAGSERRVGFESRSTDIPATPESIQQPRRKRYRH